MPRRAYRGHPVGYFGGFMHHISRMVEHIEGGYNQGRPDVYRQAPRYAAQGREDGGGFMDAVFVLTEVVGGEAYEYQSGGADEGGGLDAASAVQYGYHHKQGRGTQHGGEEPAIFAQLVVGVAHHIRDAVPASHCKQIAKEQHGGDNAWYHHSSSRIRIKTIRSDLIARGSPANSRRPPHHQCLPVP